MIYCGDCLDILPTLGANSVDSIVTDPPYGLNFMGKNWDKGVPGIPYWAEALRVAKPGAHLLAFGGTRTYHRLVCAIEDAGWEIRDTIAWVYGSGFPKSLDVSKAIDKMAGAEREVVGKHPSPRGNINATCALGGSFQIAPDITAPATEAAKQWDGWGTALKPSFEPICVARKPFKGNVAENVLEWGCGGINVDGCRVGTEEKISNHSRSEKSAISKGKYGNSTAQDTHQTEGQALGRFPANVIHDGSDEVVELFPETASGGGDRRGEHSIFGRVGDSETKRVFEANSGSASRFFYCAKASKSDRGSYNNHPTVKPTDLMRYLCRLVTPPGGTVLDLFAGSCSTGRAAMLEGFEFIGIEKDPKWVEVGERRIRETQPPLPMPMSGKFTGRRRR